MAAPAAPPAARSTAADFFSSFPSGSPGPFFPQLAESRPRVRGQFVRVQRETPGDGSAAAAVGQERQQLSDGSPGEEEEQEEEEEEGSEEAAADQAGARAAP